MSKIKKGIFNILRGGFLVTEDAFKNWRFISFIVVLMLLMIASGHSSDKKVMEIAALNQEIQELRAQFVDYRSVSMKIKLESNIKRKVKDLGLAPGKTPPKIIKVVSNK